MKKLLLFLTIALFSCTTTTTKITYSTRDSKSMSDTESFTIKYEKGKPVAWKSIHSNNKWMPMYNGASASVLPKDTAKVK